MMFPRNHLENLTLKFPENWLARKQQGLLPPSSRLTLSYRGPVGLLKFGVGALDPTSNLLEQVLVVRDALVGCRILTEAAWSDWQAMRLHDLSFAFDFPSKHFFYARVERFLYDGIHRRSCSDDFRRRVRTVNRKGRKASKGEYITRRSFVIWGPIDRTAKCSGFADTPNRMNLRLWGDFARPVGLTHLDGDLDQVLKRLTKVLAIRLSRATDPQNLKLNGDLVTLMQPSFLEIFRQAGWFETSRHIRRRFWTPQAEGAL